MNKSRNFFAVVCLFTCSMMSYATSFDCTKASTDIEKSICGNPSLGVLDEQLATTYHKAYNDSPSKDELKTQQREWVKNIRNKCTSDDCLSSAYSSRIDELNQVKSLPTANEQPSILAVPQQTQNDIVPTQVETTAIDSSGLKTQTIIAEGVGSNVESAAQNAAENALKQVVGTFIDAKKQLDKHTEIADGIRSETKNISTNIKEYSQGTIKGFKVVESQQESSLTRVTAEVIVRIDDFHAYIKKLAEGEVAVEEGLFVKMKSEQKQQTNQADLLYDNVISPIVSGEVIEFTVGEPKTLSDIGYKGGSGLLDKLSTEYGNTNIVAFRINVSLNKEFVQNMRKTIESTVSKKTTFYASLMGMNISWKSPLSENEYASRSPLEDGYSYLNDTVLLIHDGKHTFSKTPKGSLTIEQTYLNEPFLIEAYLFSGSKQELIKKASWLPDALSDFNSHLPRTNLEVILTGFSGDILQKEITGDVSSGKLIVSRGDYADEKSFNFETPWSMIGIAGANGDTNLMIWENRSFIAFIAINPDALEKTKKIKVKLVN